MEDDGGIKDWTIRHEAAKDPRKEQEAAKAERDERLKSEGGKTLFEQLHAWMKGQAESYNEQTGKRVFEVGKVEQFGGPAHYHFFKVSSTKSERLPMTISYQTPPSETYRITVDCGTLPKPHYPLSVGDNGTLHFETRGGQPRTIEELGSELFNLFKR